MLGEKLCFTPQKPWSETTKTRASSPAASTSRPMDSSQQRYNRKACSCDFGQKSGLAESNAHQSTCCRAVHTKLLKGRNDYMGEQLVDIKHRLTFGESLVVVSLGSPLDLGSCLPIVDKIGIAPAPQDGAIPVYHRVIWTKCCSVPIGIRVVDDHAPVWIGHV